MRPISPNRDRPGPPGSASSRRAFGLVVVAVLVAACGASPGSPSGRPAATTSSTVPGSPAPASTSPGPSGSTPASTAPSPGAFDPARVEVHLEPVVDGLQSPLAVVNAGDGSGRLFVAEQGGRIRIVRDGRLVDRPFLDIADRVTSGGERGLLGVAFHPGYPNDPRVFVDYTDTDGNTRVSSFTVDPADPDRLDPASERRLLFVQQPFANHNGGALVFDRTGLLLVSLGDGGSGGDPQGNGQSLTTLLGKILRIDVDRTSGDRRYGIPPDNPYANDAGGNKPEIWLWGLRNPWRMSIDRATGDLWIGDVGQNAWEEVDVQRASAPGGTNFGWNRMEGTHCFLPPDGCQDASLSLPVTDYGRNDGSTVIGGVVYRGTAQPALRGGYVFADFGSGRIWALDPASDGYRAPTLVAGTDRSLSAFGEDEAGEVYATDLGGGALVRVTATSR